MSAFALWRANPKSKNQSRVMDWEFAPAACPE
jgi:hypothetical protein